VLRACPLLRTRFPVRGWEADDVRGATMVLRNLHPAGSGELRQQGNQCARKVALRSQISFNVEFNIPSIRERVSYLEFSHYSFKAVLVAIDRRRVIPSLAPSGHS